MIKILDCTLRDGGYYNKWQFSEKLINDYIKKINEAKIDISEVGFRFNTKSSKLGISAYSNDNYLRQIKSNYSKICIMVNAADLILDRKFNKAVYKKLFLKKLPDNVYMVRIACHLHELKILIPYLKVFKKKFRNVAVNLMQISEMKSKDLLSISKELEKKKNLLEVFYIADSLGRLNKKKIFKIVKLIKKNWSGEIGFHAHDNMRKALSNCRTAITSGITWIDSTLLGMGRGPGNVKTEELITSNKIFTQRYNKKPIQKLLKQYFIPLKKKYQWGTNNFYYLAAKNKIHPTYIQTLISDKQKENVIYRKIKILSKINSKNFNPDFLDYNVDKKNKSKILFKPEDEIKNREVLIIGNGKSVSKQRRKIEKFIKRKNLYTINLNTKKNISEKFINLRISSHPLRVLSNIDDFTKIENKIIIPSSFNRKKFTKFQTKKNIHFFPFRISKNKKFLFQKNLIQSPSNLSISFALGIVNLGKAKKIYIAGFDGFENFEYKNIEFDEMINSYYNCAKSKNIFSITNSKFNLNFLKKI